MYKQLEFRNFYSSLKAYSSKMTYNMENLQNTVLGVVTNDKGYGKVEI